ncbi:MAG: alpha/beta fold hydrolase, partial [Anaerolineales bacterium]
MDVDIELYRREVRISEKPLLRLSAIDLSPDRPARTMVFIHGYGGHAVQWRYQLQAFSDDSRCIALDLRGFGMADKPADAQYTMSEFVNDIDRALDVLGVTEPFVLLGHSFGGAIVAEYALAHPERVSKLVLLASAVEYNLHPVHKAALRLPTALLNVAQAAWLKDLFFTTPHIMQTMYRNTLSGWNGRDLFRQLRGPTLVIRGNRDVVFEPKYLEEVARIIPDAEEVNVGASA